MSSANNFSQNAVIGVGSSSAHWEARRTQDVQDKRSYYNAQIEKLYRELNQPRQLSREATKWYYKEAPKVLSDKWTSQTSYRRFPRDRREYVYSAKLPSRFSNTNYFQQW
ncbi:uncharacterized protein LOC142340824 [Convolutriloba macropyga]|uniref:uncharacterized protein LOC142340824 n=1 Tax=Convolutriloba macropyga TaxID=536237 RepID=UPI003F5229A3